MTENMRYYTERLQCSNEEKDVCLETAAKLYHLRKQVRDNGFLAAETLAAAEPDPFFQTGLMEFAELYGYPDRLERLLTQYLMAGNYRGGAFLNAVLISQGLPLLSRYESTDEGANAYFETRDWGKVLCDALRGYFGAEYREKVMETIRQAVRAEQPQQEEPSLMPEFDDLAELSPAQRDWLVRHVSGRHLRYALKSAGSAVSEFLLEGVEDREALERDISLTCNVRKCDVLAAQRTILLKAEEARSCT